MLPNATILESMQGILLSDLLAFLPELVICLAILVFLLLRLFSGLDRLHLGSVALGFTAAALAFSWEQWRSDDFGPPVLFTGLLANDSFTVFLRLFLYGFAFLMVVLSLLTGIPDREDSADFYVLLLGATLGMVLMASANHLLMVFLAIEMASLPSYALAGFLKGRRASSEAALKYVVYGGGSAGVMLYGISLLVGKFGTGYLPDLGLGYAAALKSGLDPVLLLGTMLVLIGIAFKLAAVPFHFWCPDVFEGAATEVAAFLSVASKGAALALLARLTLGLAGLTTGLDVTISIGFDPVQRWLSVARYLAPALAFFAALTATFGNLAAYRQTNLKRLLAYSTIAHAGYMMMGLATLTREGASAVLFYLIAYLVMNLGAFAIVAFLRNQTGSEDLTSYSGLVQRAPALVVALGVCLFSLVGIPPLVGFAAKFQVFAALYHAGQAYAPHSTTLAYTMYALLFLGGLNTVLSLFYYLNVMKVMVLDRAVEGEAEAAPLPVPTLSVSYAAVLAVALLVLGALWNPLAVAGERGVEPFRKPAPRPALDQFPQPMAR